MAVQIGKKYMQGHGRKLPKTVGKTSLFVKHIFEKSGQDEMYQFDSASLVYLRPVETAVEEEKTAKEEERAREYILREKETMKLITKEEKIREFHTNVIKENTLPSALDMLREKSFRQQLSVQLELLVKECQEIEHRTQPFADHEEMGEIWQKFREERHTLEQYRKDWNDAGSRQESSLQKQIKEQVEQLSLYRTILEKKEQEIIHAKTVLHKIQRFYLENAFETLEDSANLKTMRLPIEQFPHSEMTDRTMPIILEETQIQKAAEEIETVIQRILEIQTTLEENRELSKLQTENPKTANVKTESANTKNVQTQNVQKDNEFNGFHEMQEISESEMVKQKQVLFKELLEETTIGNQEIVEQIYQLFSKLSQEERIEIKRKIQQKETALNDEIAEVVKSYQKKREDRTAEQEIRPEVQQEVQKTFAELSEEEQELSQKELQKEALQKKVRQSVEKNTESALQKVLLEEIVTIFLKENENLKTFLENKKKAETAREESIEKKAEIKSELQLESLRNTENAEAKENTKFVDNINIIEDTRNIEDNVNLKTMRFPIEEFPHSEMTDRTMPIVLEETQIQKAAEEIGTVIQRILEIQTTLEKKRELSELQTENLETKKQVLFKELLEETTIVSQEVIEHTYQLLSKLSQEERIEIKQKIGQKETVLNDEIAEAVKSYQKKREDRTAKQEIRQEVQQKIRKTFAELSEEEQELSQKELQKETLQQEVRQSVEKNTESALQKVLLKEIVTIFLKENEGFKLFLENKKKEETASEQNSRKKAETQAELQLENLRTTENTEAEENTQIAESIKIADNINIVEDTRNIEDNVNLQTMRFPVEEFPHSEMTDRTMPIILEEAQIQKAAEEIGTVIQRILEIQTTIEEHRKLSELQIENLETQNFKIQHLKTENLQIENPKTANVKAESAKSQNVQTQNMKEVNEFNGFHEVQEILESEAIKQKQVLFKELLEETTIVSQKVIEHTYQLLSELSKEERIEIKQKIRQKETVLNDEIAEVVKSYQKKREGRTAELEIRQGVQKKVQKTFAELSEKEQELSQKELKENLQGEALQQEVRQRIERNTEVSLQQVLLEEIVTIFLKENEALKIFLENKKKVEAVREQSSEKKTETQKELQLKSLKNTEAEETTQIAESVEIADNINIIKDTRNIDDNVKTMRIPIEEFPHSEMTDRTTPFILEETQLQKAAEEMRTVIQRILEIQTSLEEKRELSKLQTENPKTQSVQEDNEYNGFYEVQTIRQKQVLLKELLEQTTIGSQEVIEYTYQLLSELSKEERIEIKREVEKQETVSKEQILEFAEGYQVKKNGKSIEQKVQQILTDLSEEEQEVLRNELKQRMSGKTEVVPANTLLSEIRMIFLEDFLETTSKESKSSEKQIQEAIQEIEIVMQRILEFQTNTRRKEISQELQEIFTIEDVEFTVENKIIHQNTIEKVHHLLSELNEEEWTKVKQEVQKQELVSKEQILILEFAEGYQDWKEEKLVARKVEQKVRQVLTELSEEEQEVLQSELEQKVIKKLPSVHAEMILHEIQRGFFEESEIFNETVYEQIQEQAFELTKDSQIQGFLEQRELHTQKERMQREERLQHYQNQTEKVEKLREEQQKQFRMLQEVSQQQAEQLVKIENWQQEIRQRLIEQEEAQPLKNQEDKTLRKFQEQLRMERLRRGLI